MGRTADIDSMLLVLLLVITTTAVAEAAQLNCSFIHSHGARPIAHGLSLSSLRTSCSTLSLASAFMILLVM
jgi:hypothetical protein